MKSLIFLDKNSFDNAIDKWIPFIKSNWNPSAKLIGVEKESEKNVNKPIIPSDVIEEHPSGKSDIILTSFIIEEDKSESGTNNKKSNSKDKSEDSNDLDSDDNSQNSETSINTRNAQFIVSKEKWNIILGKIHTSCSLMLIILVSFITFKFE